MSIYISKVYTFKDDEIEGTINILSNQIHSYGITVTKINENTGLPEMAAVWVNTGNMNFNRLVTYEEAIEIEKDIKEVIGLLR